MYIVPDSTDSWFDVSFHERLDEKGNSIVEDVHCPESDS